MESYVTILNYGKFEYEDRKSIFIGEAMPVSTEEEALAFIDSVKKHYPDARHHVYAYVLRQNSIMRFTDDREPQGTAGMPVLDVIRKNSCVDVAIVVVRYFGGTLLGTGGLVHAYTSSAAGALKCGNIIKYDVYTSISVGCSYSDYQKILPRLSELGFKIENTDYGQDILISGRIIKVDSVGFCDEMTQITAGRAEIRFLGEKYDF